jgi:hypothetical protein
MKDKKANQESAIERLVDLANDPHQSPEVRAGARRNIENNARHLILPDGRIVTQDSYDRLTRLMVAMEAS